MFRMIGGAVVYGFGAYGLFTFIQRLRLGSPSDHVRG